MRFIKQYFLCFNHFRGQKYSFFAKKPIFELFFFKKPIFFLFFSCILKKSITFAPAKQRLWLFLAG